MTTIDQSDIYEEATNTSKDGLSRCFDKNTGSELHIALSGLLHPLPFGQASRQSSVLCTKYNFQ